MKNARVVCVLVCAMLCLLGISASVSAQGDVAAVTGRVFDPNAAIIIEATVTARNVDSGVKISVVTNEGGIYRFANLSPGNYEFTVSKKVCHCQRTAINYAKRRPHMKPMSKPALRGALPERPNYVRLPLRIANASVQL